MSDEPKYRDEEWLREQYVEQWRTTREIAEECACAHPTITVWLSKHGIEPRDGGKVASRRLRDEDWLREQYVKKGRSSADISADCECGANTVRDWLKKHGIKTRRGGQHPTPDRLKDGDWLREQYVKKERTAYDIAEECGCVGSTVYAWLKKHGIEARRGGQHPTPDRLKDGDWLREQYVKKERSSADISAECGCSAYTVLEWLRRHGIEVRDMGRDRNPRWNGGPETYGPGWNDSKRRQVRERDGYECADCGTTQTEHKTEYGEKLHVHHLIKARDIDDPEERNAPENLITLCRDCHREWERLSEAGIRPQIDGVTAD